MKKEKSYLSTLSCYTQLWKFLAICFFIEEFKKKEKESATEYLLLLLLLFTKRRKFPTIYFY
jgi:hypothetical protein